jgi:CRP/FNR family cyclic AMP-dependent transcriptional regulator
MSATIALSEGLRDEDVLWLFQVGEEKVVRPGTAIVNEGVRPNAIFVVLRGGFSVGIETLADGSLAKLGSGELIGEISFLEGSPASATIVAGEESAVLVIDNQALNERIREDTAFAARMYRAFALVAERRLRNRVDHLAFLFEFGRATDSLREFSIPAVD